MRQLPPLNGLKAFEAAARLSSVTAAAEELCVTHSSVSQHIKQLESYFGIKLFDRRGRGLEPTPSARAYAEDLRTSFDRIAVSTDRLTRSGDRRALSINTTPSFAMRWLIPKATEFQSKNPNVALVTSTSNTDAISHLDTPQDFIIRREPMKRVEYDCFRLLNDLMTPVASSSFLKKAKPKEPADLLNLELLHMRSRPDAWNRWFVVSGVSTIGTVGGLYFDHFFLSLEAAINGQGIAIVPKVLVEDDLESGRLVAPFPKHTLDGPGFHLLYRRDVVEDRAGQLFFEWLLDTARADRDNLPRVCQAAPANSQSQRGVVPAQD